MTAKKEPRSRAEWLQTVQDLIVQSMSDKQVLVKTKDGQGKHSLMKDMKWVDRLTREVIKEMPRDYKGDGNMHVAYKMALILMTWYVRVHHAKINDPRRPLKVRREVYQQWLESQSRMVITMLNEQDDSVFKQPWNDPFLPGARGGKFV